MLPKSRASLRAASKPPCPRWPLCKMSAMSSSAPSASTPQRVRRSLGGSKASLGCNGGNRARVDSGQVQRVCANFDTTGGQAHVAISGKPHSQVLDVLERRRTARTVEGHHWRPPWPVGIPSRSSRRAISARVAPCACSWRMRATTSAGSVDLRPERAGRRRGTCGSSVHSARKRSNSAAGISRAPHSVLTGFRFHDLRHTYAALMVAAGAHPKYLQAQMGHSSIRVTLDLCDTSSRTRIGAFSTPSTSSTAPSTPHRKRPEERAERKKSPRAGTLRAGATGLEPATSGVTGRRSNQLNYAPRRPQCIGSKSRSGRVA
jgi:hypothetical protein